MMLFPIPTLASLGLLLAQTGTQNPAGATNSGGMITLAIILFGLAVVLFVLEIIIPSGGLLGSASIVIGIIGIVMCFRIDTTLGLLSTTLCLIALPILTAAGIKMAPETPIFRMLSLKATQPTVIQNRQDGPLDQDTLSDNKTDSQATTAKETLVGKQGKALTEHRPVGTCLIDGERLDCLSAEGLIEPGQLIEVVTHDGMNIKVRPISKA